MTMQQTHSPKPKIFGEGYGKHLAYNYRLVKKFFKLGFKVLINAVVPGVYYEQAHWGVIELYHEMRGYRYGTHSDHRCSKCGGDFPSRDEAFEQRNNLKYLKQRIEELENHICPEQSYVEPVYPDRAGGELHSTISKEE